MRIDLTVVGSDGTARDVALEAPGSTPVADVACALGVDASALAIRGLASGEDLASSGLRSGAVLPAPNPAAPSPSLALTVTGGRAAGLVLPLRRGRLVIGRTAACDLVLPDERVSRRHAELVVAGGVVSVRDLGCW
jgi:S-DNA-T family DNA segregation ATPase FtsK/SpoIIIE